MKRLTLAILLSAVLAGCGTKTATEVAKTEPTAAPTTVAAPVADEQPMPAADSVMAEAQDEEAYDMPLDEEPPVMQAQQPQQSSSGFNPQTPAVMRRSAEMGLGLAQQRLSLCQSGYQMAQQMGDQNGMNLYGQEIQMHQEMMGVFQNWLSNPNTFADEQSCLRVLARMHEYDYRSNTRDMRPSDQIQGDVERYVAYAAWKAGTPQGQQAHQADMAAMQAQGDARTARHNQNMANMQAQQAAHSARMADMQAAGDARNAAWSANQQSNYEQHQRNTHAIYDEYQYNDPNTGQGYWVNSQYENPAVVNPDGTQTELQPYSSSY